LPKLKEYSTGTLTKGMSKKMMRIMIRLIPPESRTYLVEALQETVMMTAVVTVDPTKIVPQMMTGTPTNGKRRRRRK
jgi:hypothetical protein